jgi:hypothetical protein
MRRTELDPRILEKLKEKLKGKVSEHTIRSAISRIRRDNPSLTLNAAAEVLARKHNESVQRYLNDKDRDALKTIQIEKVKILSSKLKRKRKFIAIAKYETNDKWLKAHLDEINKTYTFGCYTATFILCRKLLENLIIHHVLKKKYPNNSKQHREKYFDFNRNRTLDFEKLLLNLKNSSNDFMTEKSIVERVCNLSEAFKETANEMTHSLYHIASKKEIDGTNFQQILDLIAELEKNLASR